MSGSYTKYIEILPTQTANYVELPNSQDSVIFQDLNYFCNLWESDILIKRMTLTAAANLAANVKMLILSKLGCFQKFTHKEMGQVLYEQVYQQEKCRLDSDVYWDCTTAQAGNVFFSRVQQKGGNQGYAFQEGRGIQFQVIDDVATGSTIGQKSLLKDGQMSNYFVAQAAAAGNSPSIVLENVRIPLKYMLWNTMYQTKQMNGFLPLKNSQLEFQFAQFDKFIKRNDQANQGISADLGAIIASGLQSVTYENISLILCTKNYIPLEKPITFSVYHPLVEKQTIQTKQNELDLMMDKTLLQLFFQYYPTLETSANIINPGFVQQDGTSNIIVNELHYGSDKILPRLTGNDQLLKTYVQDQLRVINPKLDIDQFFKQTNIVPIIFDNEELVGEQNPQKVRIRYETANTNYQLLMYQITSRLIQISQDGIQLIA